MHTYGLDTHTVAAFALLALTCLWWVSWGFFLFQCCVGKGGETFLGEKLNLSWANWKLRVIHG